MRRLTRTAVVLSTGLLLAGVAVLVWRQQDATGLAPPAGARPSPDAALVAAGASAAPISGGSGAVGSVDPAAPGGVDPLDPRRSDAEARALARRVRLQMADLATGIDRWRRARSKAKDAAVPSIEELRSWDRALLAHSAWIALTRGQPGADDRALLEAYLQGGARLLDPALLEPTADYLGRTHLAMLLELDAVVSDPNGAAFDVRRRAAIADRVWTLAKVSVGNSNDIAESRLLREIEDPQVPTPRIVAQLEQARRDGDRHLAAYGARQLAAAQGVRDLTSDEVGRLHRLERRLERQKERG